MVVSRQSAGPSAECRERAAERFSCRKHRRQVARKVLRPDIGEAIGPERFLREVELTARLQHPHILPMFDSGGSDERLWYTMPYIDGETLRARMSRTGALSLTEVLRIARVKKAGMSYVLCHQPKSFDWRLRKAKPHPRNRAPDTAFAAVCDRLNQIVQLA